MENLNLVVNPIGADNSIKIILKIGDIIHANWPVIYLGANRLNCAIKPSNGHHERIKICGIELCKWVGVLSIDEWVYGSNIGPTNQQIKNLVRIIQLLIDTGSENINEDLKLSIE